VLEEQLTRIRGQASPRAGKGSKRSRGNGIEIKVPPAYRHRKTGEEWSGRGNMAIWLRNEIEAGKRTKTSRSTE
jgi:DNA-binding protein H-NS